VLQPLRPEDVHSRPVPSTLVRHLHGPRRLASTRGSNQERQLWLWWRRLRASRPLEHLDSGGPPHSDDGVARHSPPWGLRAVDCTPPSRQPHGIDRLPAAAHCEPRALSSWLCTDLKHIAHRQRTVDAGVGGWRQQGSAAQGLGCVRREELVAGVCSEHQGRIWRRLFGLPRGRPRWSRQAARPQRLCQPTGHDAGSDLRVQAHDLQPPEPSLHARHGPRSAAKRPRGGQRASGRRREDRCGTVRLDVQKGVAATQVQGKWGLAPPAVGSTSACCWAALSSLHLLASRSHGLLAGARVLTLRVATNGNEAISVGGPLCWATAACAQELSVRQSLGSNHSPPLARRHRLVDTSPGSWYSSRRPREAQG